MEKRCTLLGGCRTYATVLDASTLLPSRFVLAAHGIIVTDLRGRHKILWRLSASHVRISSPHCQAQHDRCPGHPATLLNRRVIVISGGLTARIRRKYRLNSLLNPPPPGTPELVQWEEKAEKNRADDRHHALDAMVINFLP
jgi:hypothetical protein